MPMNAPPPRTLVIEFQRDCCQGCRLKIRRVISKTRGIDKVDWNKDRTQLTLTGTMAPQEFMKNLRKAIKLGVRVVHDSFADTPPPPSVHPPPPQQSQPKAPSAHPHPPASGHSSAGYPPPSLAPPPTASGNQNAPVQLGHTSIHIHNHHHNEQPPPPKSYHSHSKSHSNSHHYPAPLQSSSHHTSQKCSSDHGPPAPPKSHGPPAPPISIGPPPAPSKSHGPPAEQADAAKHAAGLLDKLVNLKKLNFIGFAKQQKVRFKYDDKSSTSHYVKLT